MSTDRCADISERLFAEFHPPLPLPLISAEVLRCHRELATHQREPGGLSGTLEAVAREHLTRLANRVPGSSA